MKNILVTGGAGFIGSHTIIELLKEGFNVFVIDSFANSNPGTINSIKALCLKEFPNIDLKLRVFKGDLRNLQFIKDTFDAIYKEGLKFDGVIHFAGLKSIKESIDFPIKYWDSNVKSTINLLKIMDEYNCHKIIFSSSASIYKYANNTLIKENSELKPLTPYSTTKSVIENLLRNLYESDSTYWSILNLRYFNPIGSHHSGRIGELISNKPSNIFPSILKVAIGEMKTLKIFGNDWDTIDGTGVRDYIHITDLARSHVAALTMSLKIDKQFLNLNIGTGIGTSVLQLVKTFSKVNKIDIPYKIKNRRPGDIGTCVACNSLALSLMDWQPTKNIEDMCKDGWKWMKYRKENIHGYY